jgi:hypothetical protein
MQKFKKFYKTYLGTSSDGVIKTPEIQERELRERVAAAARVKLEYEAREQVGLDDLERQRSREELNEF